MSSAERNLGCPTQSQNNTWISGEASGHRDPALHSWWGPAWSGLASSASFPPPGHCPSSLVLWKDELRESAVPVSPAVVQTFGSPASEDQTQGGIRPRLALWGWPALLQMEGNRVIMEG